MLPVQLIKGLGAVIPMYLYAVFCLCTGLDPVDWNKRRVVLLLFFVILFNVWWR